MVRNVFGGGDQAWATVELVAVAECKSGMSSIPTCGCGQTGGLTMIARLEV